MLFSPDMIEAIRAGRKTQTRRPVKEGDNAFWFDWPSEIVMVTDSSDRCKWNVYRTYSICPGRGKHAVGSFRLLKIRRECVSDISEADAQAEGFNSRAEFLFKWRLLYGATADLSALVWVLTFEVVS